MKTYIIYARERESGVTKKREVIARNESHAREIGYSMFDDDYDIYVKEA